MHNPTYRIILLAGCFALGSAAAHAQSAPATSTSPADCSTYEQRRAAAQQTLEEQNAVVRERLEGIAAELAAMEKDKAKTPADEFKARSERLARQREALQRQLKFLTDVPEAWKNALDSCENITQRGKEQAEFRADVKAGKVRFVRADLNVFQTQLDQSANLRRLLGNRLTSNQQRLTAIGEELSRADEVDAPPLQAERALLSAQVEQIRMRLALSDVEDALSRARLAAAKEALGPAASQPATTSAPSREGALDAENKRKLAEQLKAEAWNRLDFARTRLKEINAAIDEAERAGSDKAALQNDREYWHRVEVYEQRRIRQAGFDARAAVEKQELGKLTALIREMEKSSAEAPAVRKRIDAAEAQRQAAAHRKLAVELVAASAGPEKRATEETRDLPMLQEMLAILDPMEQALEQRTEQAIASGDYQKQFYHFKRMKRQIDDERQQIDLMIMTRENIAFALTRQATLHRRLAELHTAIADVLVPPEQPFWERHRKVLNSAKIVGTVIGTIYLIRLLVWLIHQAVFFLGTRKLAENRFSPKRANTLISFGGSLARLVVWITGLVWLLNELGIDPAKSAGALGLIGLIMAGMFQQLVVDFVKGLDIVAGGHYDVGDFIEVDGKLGHVVDLDFKHTRIRTLSGQEYNLPNSRCVPSRRFPEGYVNNYVDITVKSGDEQRARAAIDAICEYLNDRMEFVRDKPAMVLRFNAPMGGATLRYRVRVLPGCAWVIRDYFIPMSKEALARQELELLGEPTFFFINRIRTFRKLFSRQMSEEEILRETATNR